MLGVGLLSFCCIMFIHLGLGDTIGKVLHLDFILLRCTKCLNFWMVLTYTLLIVKLSVLESLATAFAMSYLALWVDLILNKMAHKYDYWYEMEERKDDREDE